MERSFRGGGHRSPRPEMGGSSFAPVQVGEELDVKIEAVGEKGDGIAKKNGFVLFVPNTKQGDDVKIRVTKVLRKVGFAEVVGQASGTVSADSGSEQGESQDSQESTEAGEEQYSGEDSEDFGDEEEK